MEASVNASSSPSRVRSNNRHRHRLRRCQCRCDLVDENVLLGVVMNAMATLVELNRPSLSFKFNLVSEPTTSSFLINTVYDFSFHICFRLFWVKKFLRMGQKSIWLFNYLINQAQLLIL